MAKEPEAPKKPTHQVKYKVPGQNTLQAKDVVASSKEDAALQITKSIAGATVAMVLDY